MDDAANPQMRFEEFRSILNRAFQTLYDLERGADVPPGITNAWFTELSRLLRDKLAQEFEHTFLRMSEALLEDVRRVVAEGLRTGKVQGAPSGEQTVELDEDALFEAFLHAVTRNAFDEGQKRRLIRLLLD